MQNSKLPIASRKKRRNIILISAVIIVVALTALLIVYAIHRSHLRDEMNTHIEATLTLVEDGNFAQALIESEKALEPATQLRDESAVRTIYSHIEIIDTVLHADAYYHNGGYNTALHNYQAALSSAEKISGFSTDYIETMAASAQGHIDFADLIQQADNYADAKEYEQALTLYEEAAQTAASIPYPEGRKQAAQGVKLMEEEIALAKWREEMLLLAETHMKQGSSLLTDEAFDAAIDEFQSALDIYLELHEASRADNAAVAIEFAMHRRAEKEAEEAAALEKAAAEAEADQNRENDGETDNTHTDAETSLYIESNFEHNSSIHFDLRTMIDKQDSEPASLVRMGTVDDMNEGWYNGCGWIAVYNLLIMLDNPRHPADIVRYFETSGGTVMDGVFGTYPFAIENYLDNLGYNVRQTLFPRSSLSVDNEIKSAGACILAYAHTSAAHYVAIEYFDNDDRFIVYNDSLAQARSRSLNLSETSTPGAVIDSVEAWLSETSDILFAISLITVAH